jgi:NTP pyrophosphatase (non-canonical NTP hydrolase)
MFNLIFESAKIQFERMELSEYQLKSKRTCASLGSLELDLAHMVLGINTEILELEEAIKLRDFVNISEECIDIFWYVSNYCTFRGLNLEDFIGDNRFKSVTIENLYKQTSILQDLIKKYVAYKKEIDPQIEGFCLMEILYVCRMFLQNYNLDLSTSLNNNIEKLKQRFPEKFSEEQAINRDSKAERKILEQ